MRPLLILRAASLLPLSACAESARDASHDDASISCEAGTQQPAAGDAAMSAMGAGTLDARAHDAQEANTGDAQTTDAADGGVPLFLPEVDATFLPDGGKACFTPPSGLIELSESSVYALEGCTVLRGHLRMGDQFLVTTALFPKSLRVVEESLNFFRNESLQDISALKNLEQVGSLDIHHNYKLETLHGLESLRTVRGALLISSNTRLRDLHALSALESVGELNFGLNEALPQSEIDWLRAKVWVVPLDGGS